MKTGGINEPQSHVDTLNNSYLKKPIAESFDHKGNALEQSTASLNESHSLSNANLLALVNKTKKFSINSAGQVRDLLVRKGLRLFWELNSNLISP